MNFSCEIILAFALKCWECLGKDDPHCSDPFDGGKQQGNHKYYVDCVLDQNQEAKCITIQGMAAI